MQKFNIYKYYVFGYNHFGLKRYGVESFDKTRAVKSLSNFLRNLDELDLQVTKSVASDLVGVVKVLRSQEEESVTAEQAAIVKSVFDKLDPTLDAELKLRFSYTLTKKIFSLETLLDSPLDLLSGKSVQTLASTTVKDFRAACKAVAFNQPTAAAFHLMRALEAQVKVLYYHFKKTKRLEKPMWGAMTKQLREKRAPKPTEKLLSHLDNMRVHFRNPTQHPEAFYSDEEAQDLLSQTIVAINMISTELPLKDIDDDLV